MQTKDLITLETPCITPDTEGHFVRDSELDQPKVGDPLVAAKFCEMRLAWWTGNVNAQVARDGRWDKEPRRLSSLGTALELRRCSVFSFYQLETRT